MGVVNCDLMDIGQAENGCSEEFAGFGNHIYVAYPEDLAAPPQYEADAAEFTTASFKFKEGKGAWKIRIKKRSAKVDSTGNEGSHGYNVQLTFVIDKDQENAAKVLRILKNRGDAIFFAENPEGGYTVVYDPTFGTEVNNNYTSGDTPESESGHTVTVTSNPNKFAKTIWKGTLQLKSAAGGVPGVGG